MKKIYYLTLSLLFSVSILGQELIPSTIQTNGTVNSIYTEGNILYLGGSFSGGGYKTGSLVKTSTNSDLPLNFTQFSGSIYVQISDGNGGWYVGGSFSNVSGKNKLARVLADGTVDPTFSPQPNGDVRSLELYNGKLYVGGDFTTIGGVSINRLAKVNPITGVPEIWSPNPNGSVRSIIARGDTLILHGSFTSIGNIRQQYFGMISASTGQLLQSVEFKNYAPNKAKIYNDTLYVGGYGNTGGMYSGSLMKTSQANDYPQNFVKFNGRVYVQISDGTGGWYVGGSFTNVEGKDRLLRILSDGTIDKNFSPQPNNIVRTIALSNGKLFVGGDFTTIGGVSINRLAKVNPATGVPEVWSPNPNGNVYTLIATGDTLILHGNFSTIGGVRQQYFGMVSTSTGKLLQSVEFKSYSPDVVKVHENNIYVGGYNNTGGMYSGSLARLTPTNDYPMDFPRFNGTIYTQIPDGAGGWYVGGTFTNIEGKDRLLRILSDGTIDKNFSPQPNNTVRALALSNGKLYVGGNFTVIGNTSINRLAKLNPNTGVPEAWTPNPNDAVYNIIPKNDTLILNGNFTTIGGVRQQYFGMISSSSGKLYRSIEFKSYQPDKVKLHKDTIYFGSYNNTGGMYSGSLAKLTTTDDYPLDFVRFSGTINTQISDGAGGWYVGGSFTNVEGKNRLLRVLSDGTIDKNFSPQPNNIVDALLLLNGKLYVGGSFTNIDGASISRLAVVDPNTGTVNTSWNPKPDNYVSGIIAYKGNLLIKGNFGKIDTESRNYIAMIDTGTAKVTSFDPSPNYSVSKMYIENDLLYVSGDFTRILGTARGRIACIDMTTESLTSFNPSANSMVYDFVIEGNTMYVGGSFSGTFGGQPRNYLAKIDKTTGQADPAWNVNINNSVYAIYSIGSDLYLGGNFTSLTNTPRRYAGAIKKSNGALLSWNPQVESSVGMIYGEGNNIYIGGGFSYLKYEVRNKFSSVAMSDGLFTSFDISGNDRVYDFVFDGNDIYIGGAFTGTFGGQPKSYLVKVDKNTRQVDPYWNTDFNNSIYSLYIDNNILYVGGNFTKFGDSSRSYAAAISTSDAQLYKWSPQLESYVNFIIGDGTNIYIGGGFNYLKYAARNKFSSISLSSGLFTSFDMTGNDRVYDFVFDGNNIYVGGAFSGTFGGQPRNYLAKIDKNTLEADPYWNVSVNNSVYTIYRDGDNLYLGGNFTSLVNTSRMYAGAINKLDGSILSWNPQMEMAVDFINGFGTNLFLGGSFTYSKYAARNKLSSISLQSGLFTSFDISGNSDVYDFIIDANDIYIGGSFTGTFAGEPRSYLAKVDKNTLKADPLWNVGLNGNVYALHLSGSSLYLGGNFTIIDGQSRPYAASINKSSGKLFTWNPQVESSVSLINSDGSNLYLGGSFTYSKFKKRRNLMSIDLKSDTILNWMPEPSNTVYTIASNQNNLYIGGDFTNIGGQPRNRIAAINKTSGAATEWNPNANSTVYSIDIEDNILYMGGDFTQLNGNTQNRLASVNITTGIPNSWSPDVNGTVRKIVVSKDEVFIGGNFTTISGEPRSRLASFNKKDGSLSFWKPAANGVVYDLQINSSSVFVGGAFSQINGVSRGNLASINRKTGALTNWNPNANSAVYCLFLRNEYIFVGGNFSQITGQSCKNFALLNSNQSFNYGFFPQFNGNISTLFFSDTTLYLAGNFTQVNSVNYNGYARFALSSEIFKSKLIDFSPNKGGNTGDVTLTIYGAGFTENTSVKLTSSSLPTIEVPDSMLNVFDGTTIEATIDLRGRDIGEYNLVVEIPKDTTLELQNAFTVEEGDAANVWLQLTGFTSVRPNVWQTFSVNYGNKGNVNATGVPIYIAISKHAEVKLNNNIMIMLDDSTVAFVDTLYDVAEMDTLFGEAFDCKVYSLIVASLPPNANQVISFSVKSSTALKIVSWSSTPFYASPLNNKVAACIDDIISTALDFVPGVGCVYGLMRSVLDPVIKASNAKTGDNYKGEFGVQGSMGILTDMSWGIFKATLGCAVPGSKSARQIFKTLLDVTSKGGSTVSSMISCYDAFKPKDNTNLPVSLVASRDPNDKLGPNGSGVNKFINYSTPIAYNIRFENDPDSATTAANEVRIIDTLDMNVYDISTFELSSMYFGNKNIFVPSGRKYFSSKVDLRPTMNLIVDVEAKLDTLTGIASWRFTSLDPFLMKVNEDPFLGFLPLNINKPEGEGGVFFTIKLKENLETSVEIANKAYIYFDGNDPIVTPEWKNKVDVDLPISKVEPLPAKSPNRFEVKWSGTDKGSGIYNYTIYVSENNGPYKEWLYNTALTSSVFQGQMNATYSFYSIAKDTAGNVEIKQDIAEATTEVTSISNVNQVNKFKDIKIYPNPANNILNIDLNENKCDNCILTIYSIQGVKLINTQLVETNSSIDISQFANGFYIVEVKNGDSIFRVKLIKE